MVTFQGSPLYECETLVAAYTAVRDEFKKRWPRAFYGPQEAAAHGLLVVGKPVLTDEEARELREGLEPQGSMADALRKGTT